MGFVSFEETTSRAPGTGEVPAAGPKDCRLAFIGEAPGKTELAAGKPFAGDAGRVFDHCLHDAGIVRATCYVTNLIKTYVGSGSGSRIEKYYGRRGLTEHGIYWRDVLAEELQDVKADILVPMGGPATSAVCGAQSITSARGYLTHATEQFGGESQAVLPTLHPSSCLYGGNYINKYYIAHDFAKAKRLLNPDGGVAPFDIATTEFPSTLGEVERCVSEMRDAGIFALDIEVANFEISAISLAASRTHAYSILLQDPRLWSPREELQIWQMLADIFEDTTLAKVLQNGIFDIHFIMTHQHVFIRGPIIDTMIGHHIVYPDFLKSLRFLASVYTNVPDWKDMVKFKGGNLKKDS